MHLHLQAGRQEREGRRAVFGEVCGTERSAMIWNYLLVLQWAIKNGCQWGKWGEGPLDNENFIAEFCKPEVKQYAIDNGCPWPEAELMRAQMLETNQCS